MTAKQKNIMKYAGGLLLIIVFCIIPLLSYANENAATEPTAAVTETAPVQETTEPAVTTEPAEPAITEPAAAENAATTNEEPVKTDTPTVTESEPAATVEENTTTAASEPAVTEETPTVEEIPVKTEEPAATAQENTTTVASEPTATEETTPAAESPAKTEEPAADNAAEPKAEEPDVAAQSPVAETAQADAATELAEKEEATTNASQPADTDDATIIEEDDDDSAAVQSSTQSVRRERASLALGEEDNTPEARTAVATGADDPGISNASGSSANRAVNENDKPVVRGLLEEKPSTLEATGNDVIVEAYGIGVTRELALRAALVEAISKINGTALTNTQVEEIRYQLDAVLETFGDKAKTGGVSGQESLQLGTANQIDFTTNGLIKSYEVISEGRLNKEYEINIRAIVAKYTPSIEVQRQRIAVMPFRILNADGWQALYAEFFTQRLVDYLSQTNRFAVIDRKFMAEKHAEFDLLTGDDVPAVERVRIGNTLGSDYIVVGQINKMEYWLAEEKLPYMKSMQYTLTARTSFNLRVIVPATGVVVTSKTYDEKSELKFDSREGLKIDDIEQAEIDKLAAIAARKAGEDILNGIYPVMAIAYSPEGIFTINQGGDSVKAGQKYNLRVYGEMLVDPYTKEELGRSEKTIGMVEITEVMPKFAFAKVLELSPVTDINMLVTSGNVILRPAVEKAPEKTAPPPAKNQPKW